MLPPLTFHEYICLTGYENLIALKKIKWKDEDLKILSSNNIKE
jgi:hypothetical protein